MIRAATNERLSGSAHTSREYSEPADPLRGPFELDRHRIITSTAFRRLQNKTQVFAPALHDHFRNRLTHSLEVAHLARNLARNCGANEELCEAIALAHDLGHAPFSHAGEKALNELMAGRGGFNHNTHSVRVVEYLEHPYPAFRGLNLTRATLDGLRCHATKFDVPGDDAAAPASLEARLVSLADRLAYDLHDLEDGMGAGLITLDHLGSLPIWRDAHARISQEGESDELYAIRRPVLDLILNKLVLDIMVNCRREASQAQRNFTAASPSPAALSFSASCETLLLELEQFLLDHVYHHPDVARADAENQQIIHELFSAFMRRPESLPPRFAERIADQGPHRVICDYIAGMTDPYCTATHHSIADLKSQI